MDTPLKLNLNLSPLTSIPSNPSRYRNLNGSFLFSMRDLTRLRLTRFNLNYFPGCNTINHHRNSVLHIKPVSLARSSPMAEVKGAEKRETPPPVAADEREKKPVKELPPPPEKPEPGDCCGSGCVRCVWDVYYEELDAYNQLLKQFDSQSQSPPKS
uniref:Oxidoreductase-like domain-containing protein n=1 Tax=Opuntia streptacantha TaxID=393608 RepID=A0A7C9E3Q4_OPUST